jgi:hypothetical protein
VHRDLAVALHGVAGLLGEGLGLCVVVVVVVVVVEFFFSPRKVGFR